MTAESLLYAVVRLAAISVAWIAAYTVHSTLLLGAAWTIGRMRHDSHAVRDLLWKTALASGVATATLQTLGAVESFAGRYDVGRIVETRQWRDVPRSVPMRDARAAATSGSKTSRDAPRVAIHAAPPAPSVAPERYPARLPGAPTVLRFIPIVLVLAWFLYAVAVLVRVAFATRRARRALGERVELADPALRATFEDVAQRLGFRRTVRLTVSEVTTSPVVLGAKEICLPRRALTELGPDEQRAVLAHEVAHLVRRDPAWLLAAVTIESLFFFQPLNRMARVQLQDEAEFLSDDLARGRATSGVVLARCLARVAEWAEAHAHGPTVDTTAEMLAPALTERRASLAPRVRRLLAAGPAVAARDGGRPGGLQRARDG